MTTPAFLELQRLVRHMTDELASFRRRAFAAEARVRELEQALVAAQVRADEAARGLVAQAVADGRDGPVQTSLLLGDASGGDSDGTADGAADGTSEGATAGDVAIGIPTASESAGERVGALERENATLRQRLDGAAERTRQLLERVRFLRQQQQQEAGR